MWQKIKKGDLKVGDRIKTEARIRTCTSIEDDDGDDSASLSGWHIKLRDDGFWGADGERGYAYKQNDKPAKVLLIYELAGSDDPVEEFETLEEAHERALILARQTSPQVILDSMRIYLVTNAFAVNVHIDMRML